MGKHRRTDKTAPDGKPMKDKVELAAEFDQSVEDSKERAKGDPYPTVGNITVAPLRKWGEQ